MESAVASGPPEAVRTAVGLIELVGLIVLFIYWHRRDRQGIHALRAYAAQHGWQQLDRRATVPPVLADAVKSRRPRLLMVRQRQGVQEWLSWHEYGRRSPGNPTRYFLALAGHHPATSVRRRSKLGGFLQARRGIGTGDDEFDRVFLVWPTNSRQVAGQLTAPLRRELLAGTVPPWRICGGILIIEYGDCPTMENLEARAAVIERVAALLPR